MINVGPSRVDTRYEHYSHQKHILILEYCYHNG